MFFDVNILISLFRLSNEDVESFQKLISGAKVGAFRIITTKHLREEFDRYREKAIFDGLNNFSKARSVVNFPPFSRRHQDFDKVSEALKQAHDQLDKYVSSIKREAMAGNLFVDEVINELFEFSDSVEETDKILRNAQVRKSKGNPPGKRKDNLGDAIHWESLLEIAKPRDHLCIISSDGDFFSELGTGVIKGFLKNEWQSRAIGGRIEIYPSINAFLKQHAPEIEIGSEFNAKFLVMDLENSRSFAEAQHAIQELQDADNLKFEHVQRIVSAFRENRFVSGVSDDSEAQDFLIDLFSGFGGTEVGGEIQDLLLFGDDVF